MSKNKQKKGNLWMVLTIVLAVLTVVSAVAIPVTGYFATAINVSLGAATQKVIPDPDAQIFFWSNYENEDDLVAHEKQLCRDIEAEGAALLVNRDNTLPLAEGTKFTPFSQSSFHLLYGGTGSGQVSADDAVSLKAALEESFGADTVNLDQWKFYATCGYARVNADTTGGNQAQYRINEVPWAKYPDALKKTWAQYGDVALVVLARSGGEGADLPSGLPELEAYMTDGDYLRLNQDEIDMLSNLEQLKKEGVFKKIVVLLNSSNTLQLDFVDDYGIDAVLWIGDVGMTGVNAVADILAGKVNPSGRIVDTFLKDNHSAPAMQNFGAYPYTNGADYKVATAQNNTDPGIKQCNRDYVVYQEGIYVGYRYYETRYEDYVLNQGNAGDYSYHNDVAFPFGYGLSYTDFAYSNFKITDQGETILAEVDVTNTGKVDGKHTVQIYFQSPYTQYDMDNQVEKASVEICGFDKKLIEAGKTEHFAITVEKEDLTSYDHMNAKTYIMDAGDYYFTVGTDAHNAVNNILMAKGADSTRMSGTGDAALTAKWTLDTLDTTTYAVSAYTGNAITNLFEDADLNKYAGAEGQTVTYLSRNDWQGNFPTTQSLRVTDAMWADGLTHNAEERTAIVEKMKALYWQGATLPENGTGGTLKAIDFVEMPYEDTAWDKLVSQISYGDMLDTIYNGAFNTHALPAINLPATMEADGPTGYTKSLMGGASGMAFTSEDVIASSYSRDLAYLVGNCMAEDMLHSNQNSDSTSVAGIYAPGLNIHRSQYLGRHNEYYSEDGWLSGEIAAAQVQGIRSKGVLAFAKHFALNDQEQGRYGISVWANEQSIREVYLEAFEGAIRGGAMNVMTSFNRIGVVWSGSHYGLMTGILRDEWGMEGAAITDMSINAKWMDYRMGLLAGQDIWCGQKGSMGTLDGSENDPAIASAVHKAMKNIVYSVTRTNAMNVGDAVVLTITPTWKIALYALTGAFYVLTAAGVFLTIRRRKKNNAA